MLVERNIALPSLKTFMLENELAIARPYMERFRIQGGGPARMLSGGNQQKVVLGKWMARTPEGAAARRADARPRRPRQARRARRRARAGRRRQGSHRLQLGGRGDRGALPSGARAGRGQVAAGARPRASSPTPTSFAWPPDFGNKAETVMSDISMPSPVTIASPGKLQLMKKELTMLGVLVGARGPHRHPEPGLPRRRQPAQHHPAHLADLAVRAR